jgi:signal peptidase I
MAWVKLLVFVLVLRWLLLDAYSIPSDSMLPTLNGDPGFFKGDRVFVNKFRYGPRVPFVNKRIFDYKDPERWDIAVFKSPDPNAEHKTLIKRIVALPGERVRIKNGNIHINGKAVEPPGDLAEALHYTKFLTIDDEDIFHYILRVAANAAPSPPINMANESAQIFNREVLALTDEIKDMEKVSVDQVRSSLEKLHPRTMQLTREFLILSQGKPFLYGLVENDEYSLVPPDHYFMLGDNSGHSLDGRYFGWVPRNNLVGPAYCVWWPWAHRKDFTGFSRTWWGMLLLYGTPVALIVFFFVTHTLGRIVKLHDGLDAYQLQAGDCLAVNCASFGPRWPLLRARMIEGRAPIRGEMVLYHDEKGNANLGHVAANPGELAGVQNDEVAIESGNGDTPVLNRKALIGAVTSVCWPPGRRRKL